MPKFVARAHNILQSSSALRLLNGLLPVSSVSRHHLPVFNFLFINICLCRVPPSVFWSKHNFTYGKIYGRDTQVCYITLRCYFLMIATNGHTSSFPWRSHHHHHHHHHHHYHDYNWFTQSSICVISTFCRGKRLRIEDC